MLTPEQLEKRRHALGGSDIARIVTGKYGGLMAVCAEKWGVDKPSEAGMLAELGDAAENKIIDWALTQPGLADLNPGLHCFLTWNQPAKQLWCSEPVPIAVNMDALIDNQTTHIDCPLSAKLVFEFGMADWQDGQKPSQYAILQLQTEMLCTKADHGWIAAWFVSTGEKKLWRIERDESAIEEIKTLACRIWQEYVVPHKIPPITPENAALAGTILGRFPRLADREVEIDHPAIQNAATGLELVRAAIRNAKKDEDLYKATILEAMGDASIARLPDGRSIRLKKVARKAYTVEATEFTQITLKGSTNVGITNAACDNAGGETVAA